MFFIFQQPFKTESLFSLVSLKDGTSLTINNFEKKHFKKIQLPKLDAYDLAYAVAYAVAYIIAYAVAYALASNFA